MKYILNRFKGTFHISLVFLLRVSCFYKNLRSLDDDITCKRLRIYYLN